jgi:hypothetical protein
VLKPRAKSRHEPCAPEMMHPGLAPEWLGLGPRPAARSPRATPLASCATTITCHMQAIKSGGICSLLVAFKV